MTSRHKRMFWGVIILVGFIPAAVIIYSLFVWVRESLFNHASTAITNPGISAIVPTKQEQFDKLQRLAHQQGMVTVIVKLNVPYKPEGQLSAAQVREQHQALVDAKAQVFKELDGYKFIPGDTDWTIPFMSLQVDEKALIRLRSLPLIADISGNEGIPLVH